MNEPERISAHREFFEKVGRELSDYVVGFAKLEENREPVDVQLAGSGTLIEVDGIHAILSADHVIQNLPSSGEVGLILPTRFDSQLHRATVTMEFVEKVTAARGMPEAKGPDLGLLILPPPRVGTIKARKTFYNLSKRRDLILSNAPEINIGVWLLHGIADEWTEDSTPERGYRRVKIFRGLWGLGIVKAEYTRDGYDFLDFEARYDEGYEGPESFKGFSGSSLWQILVSKSEAGDPTVNDRILSGVAFYESPIKDRLRTIICHGRRSIYEKVIDLMRARGA